MGRLQPGHSAPQRSASKKWKTKGGDVKALFALVFLLAASNPVCAAFYSGVELKRLMAAGEAVGQGKVGADQVNAGIYLGYLAGIAESFQGIYYCPASSINLHKMVAVVANYLMDNPDKLDQSAQTLVVRALGLAYPCSRTPQERGVPEAREAH